MEFLGFFISYVSFLLIADDSVDILTVFENLKRARPSSDILQRVGHASKLSKVDAFPKNVKTVPVTRGFLET